MTAATIAVRVRRPGRNSCNPGALAATAYVPNEGSGTISVIDTTTDQVTGTIRHGKKPRGIAIAKDGKRLYLSDQTGNALVVVDPAQGRDHRHRFRSATRPRRSTCRQTANGSPRRSKRTTWCC